MMDNKMCPVLREKQSMSAFPFSWVMKCAFGFSLQEVNERCEGEQSGAADLN